MAFIGVRLHFRTFDEKAEVGKKEEEEDCKDTVGAVALDFAGNCASATSTGGLNGKAKGRVGDSPLVGAGLYADNKLGKLKKKFYIVLSSY